MSAFKDYIGKDLDIFINQNEFAEMHLINGKSLKITIDNDRLQERSEKEFDGIFVGDILFYVTELEYGHLPVPGEIINFDGQITQVFNARTDKGIHEIILQRNSS